MKPDTTKLLYLDPNLLAPHKSIESVPRLCAADFAVLKDSIVSDRRVCEPLLINADHRILDGRHRWEIACGIGLETVPCIVSTEDPVDVALRTALARRQLTETAKVLLLLEFDPTLLDGRKARGHANLKRGKPLISPGLSRDNPGNEKGFKTLAERYRVNVEYFTLLATAMEVFDDDQWGEIRENIFAGTLHAPRLACGIGGLSKNPKGGARKPIQYFKVCRRALISLKTHMERWEDFTRYERRDLLELYRQVKTALPKELQ